MYKSILQTKQWAQLKEKYGQKPHWISDVLVLEHKLPLKKSFLYAPEIDQVQLHDMDKAKFDEIARATGAVFARIEIVNPVLERADYLNDNLKGFIKSHDEIQPKNRQIIDIRPGAEAILGQMKSKGRYNIRIAERHNVMVKNYKAESTHRAENIGHEMQFWGKSEDRRSITKHQETPRLRSGRASSKQIPNSNNQTEDVIASEAWQSHPDVDAVKIFYKLYGETVRREKIAGRNIDYFYDMVDILGAKDCAEVFIADMQGEPLAAAIVTFYDGVASYLYGGSSRQHKEVMAPFALHFAIIKEAKKRNCHSYDLLGVAPEGVTSHKWAGLTRFKENFGGQNIEIIGGYDKAYNPGWYRVFRMFRKR